MTPIAVAALGGSLAGGGATLLLYGLRPARPPLDVALARLERQPVPSYRTVSGDRMDGAAGRWRQPGRWLADRPLGRPIPLADLAVLDMDPADFALRKAAMALFGLLLPGLTAALLTATGIGIGFALPAGLGLLLAVGLFFAPDLVVRGQAAQARQAFSASVGAYLDLVALERSADGAPAEALSRAAAVGNSWAFARIRQALDRARLSGTPPWQALATLAADIGVDDLRDLADILAAAGDDGAAVYAALTAKATSLRTRQLAAAKAAANTASEKLTLPGVLLCFGFLLLVCYPGLARVLGL